MKLSFWQQFSSNHSADFTVVGVFETPEAANKAADEVRQVLEAIQSWYRRPENAEIIKAIGDNDGREGGSTPMPIEVEFGRQFGFEWDEQAPDMSWYSNSENVSRAVVVIERHLFVENLLTEERTSSGARPIARLVRRLGGQAFVQDMMVGETFWIQVTCTPPNEAAAEAIVAAYYAVRHKYEGGRDTGIEVPDDVPGIYWGNDWPCEAKREGLALVLQFCEIGILSSDLPELIKYLENKGCTGIQYVFIEGQRES